MKLHLSTRFAAALVISALALTACSGGGTPSPSPAAVAPTQAATASTAGTPAPADTPVLDTSKPVTLELITWSNQPSIDAIDALNAKFTAKYPNVKVNVTNVDTNDYNNLRETRFAANDVDIFTAQYFQAPVTWAPGDLSSEQQAVVNGNYADLTDYPWISNWSTGQTAYTYNGRVYAISTGATVVTGIFYSTKLFSDHGWQVPNTWDEFVKLCNDIKAAGITPMTCGGADGWPFSTLANFAVASVEPDNNALAEGLWTGDRKFTDDNCLEIYNRLDFMTQNMEDGFMTIPYSDAPGRFAAGKAAMMPDGSWQAPVITQADPSFQFGYFPMPGTNAGNSMQGKFDLSFGVNANSANKDLAIKWLELLSDPANYADFVNTTAMVPTMDVQTSDSFTNSILPYVQNLKACWETCYRAPNGVGQYAAKRGFIPSFLVSAGGPIATTAELAQDAQQDFDTGKQAVLASVGN